MKIAVVAANGQAGKLSVAETVARVHEVTPSFALKIKQWLHLLLKKDIFDLTKEDLAGFAVVVTAFGAFAPEVLPQHTTSLEHLAGLLENTDTRLLVVGGAGSLYVDQAMTTQLSDTADFPTEFLPLAQAMGKRLARLREFSNVKWTYISPAADFVEDGEKTVDYILAGEIFTVNEAGESAISYADYAIAMLDEIEKGSHIKERISVLGK